LAQAIRVFFRMAGKLWLLILHRYFFLNMPQSGSMFFQSRSPVQDASGSFHSRLSQSPDRRDPFSRPVILL